MMMMMMLPRLATLCLLAVGTAASVADTVAARAERGWQRGPVDAGLTATFGLLGANASEQVRGMLSLRLGGVVGYQAVNWTTSGISIPASLIQEVCGGLPERQTFSYSINELWEHGRLRRAAQGPELCGSGFTGRHWDPTAACSEASGNPACERCGTSAEYRCEAGAFDPAPDASGSFAYRFLNEHACELGDLSGMHGELEAVDTADCVDQSSECEAWADDGQCREKPEHMALLCQKSCGACQAAAPGVVALRSLPAEAAGLAQMSTPFGVISGESVEGGLIGLNCDASGPPAVHATDCGCLKYNGERSPSIGTLTVFRPWDHPTFYLADPGLQALEGRSVVVQCGSTFGERAGTPLFCAALK